MKVPHTSGVWFLELTRRMMVKQAFGAVFIALTTLILLYGILMVVLSVEGPGL